MNRTKPSIDLDYPTEALGRIPAFASIDEEAAFWDSHDITDYLDESESVDLTVGPGLAGRLTLRLERADRDALVRLAGRLGVTPAELAKTWLAERLRDEATADAAAE